MCVTIASLAIAAALIVAGCAGSDDRTEGDWAGDVCADVNDWVDELDATLESLGDRGVEVSEDDLREAADRMSEATDELENGLDELGPPETDASRQAEAELETLRNELREQVEVIESALGGERAPLEAVAGVATAIAASANQVQQSLDTLERLDPGGELEDDFRTSDECVALRERIEDSDS